jgi:acyl-coenzyme A synthetase/AMP-(fatty) acid ligase
VKEVAVIGVSDAYRGESVKAFIVPKEEYAGTITEQEILNWSRDNMAAYKRPKFIEFREALPKSGTGKLLRRILVGEEKAKSQEAASKK